MKKIVNIFIIIVFLSNFIGVQINKHYSKGKLYSVAIFENADNCCFADESCEMHKNTSTKCDSKENNDFSCNSISEYLTIDDNFIIKKLSIPQISSLEIFLLQVKQNDYSNISNDKNFNTSQLDSYKKPQALSCVFIC